MVASAQVPARPIDSKSKGDQYRQRLRQSEQHGDRGEFRAVELAGRNERCPGRLGPEQREQACQRRRHCGEQSEGKSPFPREAIALLFRPCVDEFYGRKLNEAKVSECEKCRDRVDQKPVFVNRRAPGAETDRHKEKQWHDPGELVHALRARGPHDAAGYSADRRLRSTEHHRSERQRIAAAPPLARAIPQHWMTRPFSLTDRAVPCPSCAAKRLRAPESSQRAPFAPADASRLARLAELSVEPRVKCADRFRRWR